MKLHTKGYGSITCHICFYQMSADNKEAFLGHVKRHSKVPPKHCVICDEGNAENFDLRYHVQNHVSMLKEIRITIFLKKIRSIMNPISKSQSISSIMKQICYVIYVGKRSYTRLLWISIESLTSMTVPNNVHIVRRHSNRNAA